MVVATTSDGAHYHIPADMANREFDLLINGDPENGFEPVVIAPHPDYVSPKPEPETEAEPKANAADA
jgi:hypothetical protein